MSSAAIVECGDILESAVRERRAISRLTEKFPDLTLEDGYQIQSLLATAKLNDLEPLAWLKNTLEKLPSWPYSRIDELLPLRAANAN